MKKTLIVVDMQNDFIDMALGTKEAVAIVPKVKEKIQECVENRSCCAGVTVETHEAALRTMEMCQVEIVDIG